LEDTDYPGGAVSAFAVDPATGGLTFLNRQSAHGGGTCFVTVDQTGHYVLAANYRSGTAVILPIEAEGRLGEASDWVQHTGSSVNAQRQEGPHAHSINLDPFNRRAYVPDLGIDKIMIYQVDLTEGKLIANDPPFAQLQAGAGPRHFAFHPNGRYAYGINELDSTMTAFLYNEADGSLTEQETLSTLPADFTGSSACADVHVHPNGRFLYGSNRGHDSIVLYEIDEATGRLTLIGHESTQGEHPRNFGLDPTGSFLLVANQNTDNVVIFRIDQDTGQLTPTGQILDVPSPVCVKFRTSAE
jgi:6-phosphogluconolactonase